MKPITWLRKFAHRGDQGYPVATLAFYGPDDKKASKAVLGIILSKESEVSSCRTSGLRTLKSMKSEVLRIWCIQPRHLKIQ